MYSPG